MDITKLLREEIERRGLTPTDVSYGTGLPFSTVSEFIRGVRDIGTDKSSKIATFLELELCVSQLRRKAMKTYVDNVNDLESRGIELDEQSMEMTAQYVANLKWLIKNGYEDWDDDDSQQAGELRANIEWLEQYGWSGWDEDDVSGAAEFQAHIEWLHKNGWEHWSEDDVEQAESFVRNLRFIEKQGEQLDENRMEEVAEFVANLDRMKKQ